MENVPLRRFVELEVHEVSLVDSPANEKEFAILKRVEEEMPDDVKEVIEKATSSDEKLEEEAVEEKAEEAVEEKTEEAAEEKVEEKTEEAAVDPEKVVSEAVEKAIEKVGGLIDTIAKKANEKNVEKPVEKASEKAEEKADEPVTKAEKPAEEGEEEVEKAKRFTSRRIQTLKEVSETIQALVGEIVDNSIQEEVETTKSTETDETVEIFKSLATTLESLKTGFETVVKASKVFGERLDVIEKSMRPSQSVEDNGGTDTEVKKEQNIWKGLL